VSAIDPSKTRPGGIRSYVLGLAQYLCSVGIDVTLIGAGLPPRDTPFRFIPATEDSSPSSFDFSRALRRMVRKDRVPDGIVHAQRLDDIVPFISIDRGIGRIVTIHGDSVPGVRQRHGPLVAAAYRRLERRGVKAANKVLFVDSSSQAALAQRYPKDEWKFVGSRIGIDLGAFCPQDRSSSQKDWDVDNQPHVLFAGRFEAEKNLLGLARALPHCETRPIVLLAGAGRRKGEAEAALHAWPHRFLGVVPHQRMPSLYSAVNATILPSTREAMPLTCVESLACGTPVVATRTGDLPQLIRPGENGYLSETEPVELAHAIDRAVRKRDRMQAACRASVASFGWDQVGPSIVRIYREVLG